MDFLYLLEDIRMPVLNEFMLGITYFGDEIVFLVTALILFWCVDKKLGYYILTVGFVNTIANQFLKLWFRVPRPWVRDENFTILEQAREAASGYSFPSGHTQSAVGTFGSLAYVSGNKVIRWLCIAIAVLVPFSRMYVGVHTPADVLVAAVLALIPIFVLRPVVFSKKVWTMPALLGAMCVLAIGFLCFVEFYKFPADIDQHNMHSGLKNAYTIVAALFGFLIAYYVDKKYMQFPTKAVWWAQILKVAIGLGLVLVVKSGLSAPFHNLFGEFPGRALRYFLIVIVAGIIWPLTFRWFSKLGMKKEL